MSFLDDFPAPWRATRWFEQCGLTEDEVDSPENVPYTRLESANGKTLAAASDFFEMDERTAKAMQAVPELVSMLSDAIEGPFDVHRARRALKLFLDL
jgi:hypothetical protein